MVWNHWTGWPRVWLSEPEVEDYRAQSGALAHFAPFNAGFVNLTGDGEPERVRSGLLSVAVLPALGVVPVNGRNFNADETRPTGGRFVAILSYGLWQRRFAGARDVVGRTLTVNGTGLQIVGVLPPDFRMPLDFVEAAADVYLPLTLGPASPNDRGSHYLNAVARLAPGVSLPQAQAKLDAFVQRMKRETGAYDDSFGVTLVPVGEQVFGAVRPALGLVSAAVAFVLLLACVNVASLLLMRAEGQRRERAIRRAIGAGFVHLARLGFAESLIISVAGGAAGLLLAAWVVALLPHLTPASLPRVGEISIDARVFGFTAVTCVMTTLLCGVLPVWRAARSDPQPLLGEGARGSGGHAAARFRRTVIAVEVGVAVLLTVGAGLLLRSFVRLTSVQPGFEAANVLTFRLSAPVASYATDAAVGQFVADVLGRVRALPGVASAGATSNLPLASVPGDWNFAIEGRPVPGPREPGPVADWLVATPGYPESMGMRLVAGRWITASDILRTPHVVVINQSTAQKYWPSANPIGARIRLGGRADTLARTVVGVVSDVSQSSLDATPRPQMYLPHAQFPGTMPDTATGAVRGLTVTIRTTRRATDLVPELRRALHDADANVPLAGVRTLDDVVRASTATPRFALAMVGAFAFLALVIAGVGVYGVVAYVVALRTREIGMRFALGAQRGDVLRLILRQGMTPAMIGIVAGLLGALAARRVVARLLFQVPATDATAFVGAAALLAMVGLVACLLPARRASRVDPVVALRDE
jgi:putative ABC transport system permease protein